MLDCRFISIKHKGSFAKVARLTGIGSVDLRSDLIGAVGSDLDGSGSMGQVGGGAGLPAAS